MKRMQRLPADRDSRKLNRGSPAKLADGIRVFAHDLKTLRRRIAERLL